jgi:hypothetical protein
MGYSIDTSKYIHTYEAYRIPEGSSALNAENSSIVKAGGDSQLVLTEESRKQLVKDRLDYGTAMKAEQDKAYAEQEREALKKYASDQAKMITVYRNMSKGDKVSDTDEKKLMDYDPKLYQAAKMAQMLAQKAEAEKHKSEWNQEEEDAYQAKLKELGEVGNKLGEEFNETFCDFMEAQSASVVEIDASNIDLSSIKSFYKMGGGLAGAIFDVSL